MYQSIMRVSAIIVDGSRVVAVLFCLSLVLVSSPASPDGNVVTELSDDELIQTLFFIASIKEPEQRLSYIESAVARASSYQAYVLLPLGSKTAAFAGDYVTAERYADRLLKLADDYCCDWNYGNAIHAAHIAKGLASLERGDIEQAVEELLLAAETPGSPQLSTFGPNMLLAKRLLEHDRADAVVEYLNRCKQFWIHGKDLLDSWIAAIRGDGMPHFGANLEL